MATVGSLLPLAADTTTLGPRKGSLAVRLSRLVDVDHKKSAPHHPHDEQEILLLEARSATKTLTGRHGLCAASHTAGKTKTVAPVMQLLGGTRRESGRTFSRREGTAQFFMTRRSGK